MADEGAGAPSYFLSYSRSDEHFALRLAKDVRAQGVTMWVDQLDIRPSEHWDRAIERAVRDCRGLVVILSPRSVVSDNVADEISYAIDSGKSVLPVMIEKCVLPLRITRMHLIDATANYDKALKQCVDELKRPPGDVSVLPESAPVASAPLEPQAIAEAKRQLVLILGPIANILVDKAAARAGSVQDLYGELAKRIDDAADRQRFLAAASPGEAQPPAPSASTVPRGPTGAEIPPADIDSVAAALLPFLGPIAPIVAKRESRVSSSVEELRQRLAALIPLEQDRAAFLKRAGPG
jgi:hypothetical protein